MTPAKANAPVIGPTEAFCTETQLVEGKRSMEITTTGRAGQAACGELHFNVNPLGWVRIEGTRAALEAEGLLQPEAPNPSGREPRHWTANGLRLTVHRIRPPGHVGSMKSWLDLDYWRIYVDPENLGSDHYEMRRSSAKEREAKRALYELSEPGRIEVRRLCERAYAARIDARFQLFMSQVLPTPPARGRSKQKAVS